MSLYIISLVLSGCDGGRPFHPSKFLIPEEEDDGRGGGGGKTPVVLQFAKSYKLILKN